MKNRSLCAVICLMLFNLSFACPHPFERQSEARSSTLVAGSLIERDIAAGQTHSFEIALSAGQFLRILFTQKGIDIAITAFGPDKAKIAVSNMTTGGQGVEVLSLIAPSEGIYRLEVRPTGRAGGAGRYQAKVEELRAADETDRIRIEGERILEEAQQLPTIRTEDGARKAAKSFESAAKLFHSTGDKYLEAKVLRAVGLAYSFVADFQPALDAYLRALQAIEQTDDKQETADTLFDIGRVYRSQDEAPQSLPYFRRALELFRQTGNRRKEMETLILSSEMLTRVGEHQTALFQFDEAMALAPAYGNNDDLTVILNDIGTVYLRLGDYQTALSYFDQGLSANTGRFKMIYEPLLLGNAGHAYIELGEREKALEYLTRSMTLRQQIGDVGGEAIALGHIGRIHFYQKEFDKAAQAFSRSLQLTRASSLRQGEAVSLNGLGKAYMAKGEIEKAIDYFTQSRLIFRDIADGAGESTLLHNLAGAERERGRISESRRYIEEAIAIAEAQRTKVDVESLRASHFTSFQAHFEFYIDLLMQEGMSNQATAFQVSERAKARALIDLLAQSSVDIKQGVDAALIESERKAQARLNAAGSRLVRLLSRQHTEDQSSRARKEIEDARNEFQEIQARIRSSSPKYSALTQPQPLTLAGIQQQALDNSSLLLEYSLGEKRSYLWAVTSTAIKSYTLPSRAEIDKAARRVYELMTARNHLIEFETQDERSERINKADAEMKEAAASLSKMILAPVAQELKNRNLIIVPDGALQYVPFGALPVPQASVVSGQLSVARVRATNNGQRTTDNLIEDHEIISLPSASTLAVLRRETKGRKSAPRMIAVLADPVFEASDERLTSARAMKKPAGQLVSQARRRGSVESDLTRAARDVALSEREIKLQRLPFTRREAERIARLAPRSEVKKAVDFEASRATALSADMKEYRYVHFATHGFLNTRHPELSGLVLSMFDKKGAEQDGFLRANEIYNLSLPAELVVLSGCRTGLGREVKGEGLISLTRAFMYAGAARVMVSLWDINDEATAEFMSKFYTAMLKQRMTPAAALRAAQVQMSKDPRWSHPYYWAGFILQGEPR